HDSRKTQRRISAKERADDEERGQELLQRELKRPSQCCGARRSLLLDHAEPREWRERDVRSARILAESNARMRVSQPAHRCTHSRLSLRERTFFRGAKDDFGTRLYYFQPTVQRAEKATVQRDCRFRAAWAGSLCGRLLGSGFGRSGADARPRGP